MAEKKFEDRVGLMNGPLRGEEVSGDKHSWFVNSLLNVNGHIYRRLHNNQAEYVRPAEENDGDTSTQA